MKFGAIEKVTLPAMWVASYEVTGAEPEQAAIAHVENWLRKKAIDPKADGIRNFGFDCHKGREVPEGCRIYHVYFTVPDSVTGDADVEIKTFPGGTFAKMAIEDPFSGDFPLGWGQLLQWTFDNGVRNGLGCKSASDIYSLYSNEDSPCLEELYKDEEAQYMALYLPIN